MIESMTIFWTLAAIFGGTFLLLLMGTICELARGAFEAAIAGLIGMTCSGLITFILVAHALGRL